jgi:hypothetical protein
LFGIHSTKYDEFLLTTLRWLRSPYVGVVQKVRQTLYG